MKSPNSIDVYELQMKIDEKLHEIQKRSIRPKMFSGKAKDQSKIIYQLKWDAIKRHLKPFQKPNKNGNKTDIQLVKTPNQNEDLMDIINRIMLIQKSILELSTNIANYRRLQMICIFFQCSLSIVFNSYNLVVFLLKMANKTGDVPLSLAMLLLFYGYHITTSLADIIVGVTAYTGVFESIRKTATKMDELNMYVMDSGINARISQLSTYVYNNLRTFTLFGLFSVDGSLVTSIISGTTTYIIILIQYSGDGEFCKTPLNMNSTQNYG